MKIPILHRKSDRSLVGEVASWLATVCLLTVTALSLSVSARMPGGLRAFIVRSGSMSPIIPTGSIVITVPQSRYRVGDVITFRAQQTLTTHRIAEAAFRNGVWMYVTKGDANDAPDSLAVHPSNVIGRVAVSVPVLGYVTTFAKSVPGYILLILIPALLLLSGEVVSVLHGHRGKTTDTSNPQKQPERKNIRMIGLGGLLVVTALLYSVPSQAVFHSAARTSGSVAIAVEPPELILKITGNGKYLIMQLKHIQGFDELSYEFSYDADQGSQGLAGDVQLGNENSFTRQFTLGTCSSGDCVYNTHVHNLEMVVTLTDGGGTKTLLTGSL